MLVSSDIIVSISCITYNHARYIRQCLDGFLKQKTNFRFEILIHDDCSTDGTTEIIKEYEQKYPGIVRPLYEEKNQYSLGKPIGTQVWNLPRAKGKYIAMCEGDDYWIDPYKLQKQVDFLESHPDYGMCYTNFDILYYNGNIVKSVFNSKRKNYQSVFKTPEEFIMRAGYVCPPSWLIRREIVPTNVLGSLDGSFVFFTHFLATSKVSYLNFTSCVYRVLLESASHTRNPEKKLKRERNLLETQKKLVRQYSLDQNIIPFCEETYYRRNLVDFIITDCKSEIKAARNMLKKKQVKEKILFFINDLGLRNILKVLKKIKYMLHKIHL